MFHAGHAGSKCISLHVNLRKVLASPTCHRFSGNQPLIGCNRKHATKASYHHHYRGHGASFDDNWGKRSLFIIGGLSAVLYKLHNSKVKANNVDNRHKYNFIADIVSDVSPTVVNVERISKNANHNTTVSTGSGFIVDSTGLIVTNAHVIGNQSNIKVRLKDGREYPGRVVGIDESRDIAAVRIDTDSLPVIAFCRFNDLRVGEWVIAIGSPLALKNTVTIGIVSNMHRAGKELGLKNYKRGIGYIQTDATINVGNSGGPLVNLAGEVIGMNTMMASAGIAFAIPIDYVTQFLERLKNGEMSPHKRWIGIRVYNLNRDMINQIRFTSPDFPDFAQGLYVSRVDINSPAATAGLKAQDVILTVNGQDMHSSKDLHDALVNNKVLRMVVQRKDEKLDFEVIADDIDDPKEK